jgi:hypothetical protein
VWLNFRSSTSTANDLINAFIIQETIRVEFNQLHSVNGKGPPTEERAIFPVGTSKQATTPAMIILKEDLPSSQTRGL